MAKIVLICFRERQGNPYSHKEIEILSNRLTPDNISPTQPHIVTDNGVDALIFNHNNTIFIKNSSVCIGSFISSNDDWWKPMADVPDGSYALFRSDESAVELVTDIVASRTIWYFQNEELFIASTSQRAIVFLTRKFTPNKATFSWMLSTGTLGPSLSWDKRIECLGVNSRLVLDRTTWKIAIKDERVVFNTLNLSDEEHKTRLQNALNYVFEHLQLDQTKWVLPLSGGYDSRAILLMLKKQKNLRCITWGLKSSLSERKNDAYIAKSLAEFFNLDHKYFDTSISNEPIEKIFNRFLVAGEGRIDHIAGYMDGFEIWKLLFESKCFGIIRGDEGFGWNPVNTSLDVRREIGVRMFTDYSNCNNLIASGLKDIGIYALPERLQQRDRESLSTWRDRLYHEFRIPVILAALNDLKCSYVEVSNPFLSAGIIKYVREMPDHLRTKKRLFKDIVRSISPAIGIAKYPAIGEAKDILKTSDVVSLLSNELNTSYAKGLLSEKFIDHILVNMTTIDASSKNRLLNKIIKPIKYSIPGNLKNILRKTVVRDKIDYNVLAFRAYIICKMTQFLSEDASLLSRY